MPQPFDPAEKYRDKVDPQHIVAMQAIGIAHMALSQHRLHFEKLLRSKEHMDSVGCMFDPTLYRDMLYSKSFAQMIKLVNAAVAFLRVTDEVGEEIESSN